jgi:preprotein translocase subunit SecA
MGQQGDLARWAVLARQAGDCHSVMAGKSDGELMQVRSILRQRLVDGSVATSVVPEAFAVVREAARRATGYWCPEQLLVAAAALNDNFAVEIPDDGRNAFIGIFTAFLAAVRSEQANFITTDAKIAQNSHDGNKGIFRLLKMQAGVLPEISAPVEDHQRVLGCDVVYGSYLQFASEYLADHLAHSPAELTGLKHQLAVIDQVDAVLIDHADEPLIISTARQPDPEQFGKTAAAASGLRLGMHYEVERATGRISWTAEGLRKAKQILRADVEGLREPLIRRRMEDALRAKDWYRRDADYVLDGDRLAIIHEPGSKLADDSRLRSGVIQSIEAKEGLPVSGEVAMLARITVRDFIRSYDRLCGISGQAAHARAELGRLYQLDSVAIEAPPSLRLDHADVLFEKAESRFEALVADALERHQAGQPVLIGVASARDAREVSQALTRRGLQSRAAIPGAEAGGDVFAQAGRVGAMTVLAASEAHGYDIVVDGEWQVAGPEVKSSAGLAVLVAGRSRSWRSDQWLRGLAGRRGDPGESRFYLSAEDALLRGLQGRVLATIPPGIRQRADGVAAGAVITRVIDGIQRGAEADDFERLLVRLAFEDVEKDQRIKVYTIRDEALLSSDLPSRIGGLIDHTAAVYARRYTDPQRLLDELSRLYATGLTLSDLTIPGDQSAELLHRQALIREDAHLAYRRHEEFVGATLLRKLEREYLLRVLDSNWSQHLLELESMRVICSSDPQPENSLEAYKTLSASKFRAMLDRVDVNTVGYLFHANSSR